MKIQEIAGWPGYYATDCGRILSTRRPRLQELKGLPNFRGYLRVCLVAADGTKRHRSVHSLVIESFEGPRPFPDAQVLHRDGDFHNNALANLRYGTVLENAQDRELHGTAARGSKHGGAVLTEELVATIKVRLASGEEPTALALEHGVSRRAITKIRAGLTWNHVLVPMAVAS